LLRRCLEKDMSRRFRDVADVRLQIEESKAFALPAGSTAKAVAGWRRRILLGVLALIAAMATGIAVWNLKTPA